MDNVCQALVHEQVFSLISNCYRNRGIEIKYFGLLWSVFRSKHQVGVKSVPSLNIRTSGFLSDFDWNKAVSLSNSIYSQEEFYCGTEEFIKVICRTLASPESCGSGSSALRDRWKLTIGAGDGETVHVLSFSENCYEDKNNNKNKFPSLPESAFHLGLDLNSFGLTRCSLTIPLSFLDYKSLHMLYIFL